MPPFWTTFLGESIEVLTEAEAQMPKTWQHPDSDKRNNRANGVNNLDMTRRSHFGRFGAA